MVRSSGVHNTGRIHLGHAWTQLAERARALQLRFLGRQENQVRRGAGDPVPLGVLQWLQPSAIWIAERDDRRRRRGDDHQYAAVESTDAVRASPRVLEPDRPSG